ncbi:MAG: lytic transglycosylase domain-containing protein [Bdellovibrionales bacterium]|nr:lytic transglycosylase domain-containing protein [Bdellovibrionales bacterium]
MIWRLTLGLLLLAAMSGGAKYALDERESPSTVTSLFQKLDTENRLTHARELLGKHYDGSVVRNGELTGNIEEFIGAQVARKLASRWKKSSDDIAQTILFESRRYGFDPIFIMAVIDGESAFRPDAKGPVGEVGMMQLRESTAKWIAERYHMPWRGKESLRDPVVNIQLGAAYLAHLRTKFDDHGRLYLSAYNMGPKNVNRALDRKIWPKDYSKHVMSRYIKLYTRLKNEIAGVPSNEPPPDLDRTSASTGPARLERVEAPAPRTVKRPGRKTAKAVESKPPRTQRSAPPARRAPRRSVERDALPSSPRSS